MSIPTNYGGLPIGFFIQQPVPVDWRFQFESKSDLDDFVNESMVDYSSYIYNGLQTFVQENEHYYSIKKDSSDNFYYESIPKIWIQDTEPSSSLVEENDIWIDTSV